MNFQEIKELIELLDESEVSEVEFEEDGMKLVLRKARATVAMAPAPPPTVQAPIPASAAPEVVEAPAVGQEIKAPMVGTFYSSPAPGASSFVAEGKIVSKGDVLCIIEAMKLMNEIEAEISGRILKVLVEDGQPVEYGQPLFLIEEE